MGVTPSVHIPPAPSNFNYFGLIFGHTDRLRLILAPESIQQLTQGLIASNWAIQDVAQMEGFIEYKIKGMPWYGTGEYDIQVKYFICQLLQSYYASGWHQCVSTDTERTGSGKSVVIFERREPLKTSVICLSLNESDKIRVLAPPSLNTQLQQIIQTCWPYGIQRERQLGQSYEFKLKGNPWSGWPERQESINTVILINQISSGLLNSGWKLACAIRSGKRQWDVDSLYFVQTDQSYDKSHFLAVSLNKNDRLRFVEPKAEQVALFKQFVHQYWQNGIQEETYQLPAHYEFKLRGNPWYANGAETVTARQLIGDLFQFMYNNNYDLYSTLDLTRNLSSKSTLFFRSRPQDSIRPPRYSNVICVSLNEHDKIRVMRANDNIVGLVRQAIMNGWPEGIQKESNYYNSWEFKLCGWPFASRSSNQVYAALTMMYILSAFTTNGYRLITSMDVSGKYHSDKDHHYKIDLHTWYFEERYSN